MPKRDKVVTVRRSSNRWVRTLVKTLGIGKIPPVLENVNVWLKSIDNDFASEKKRLSKLRKSMTEETRFPAKVKKNLVIILKELISIGKWVRFAEVGVVFTKYK